MHRLVASQPQPRTKTILLGQTLLFASSLTSHLHDPRSEGELSHGWLCLKGPGEYPGSLITNPSLSSSRRSVTRRPWFLDTLCRIPTSVLHEISSSLEPTSLLVLRRRAVAVISTIDPQIVVISLERNQESVIVIVVFTLLLCHSSLFFSFLLHCNSQLLKDRGSQKFLSSFFFYK